MQTSLHLSFQGTNRFEIRRRIGEGAVGVVYEAFDREHRALVALKTLRTLSPEGLLSLKNEFRAVQDLRHPNLVRLGELMQADGTWFFTMELLRGLPLTDWTRASRALARHSIPPANDARPVFVERRIMEAFRQLVAGLSALHAAHKVHRDVKPSNVLVTDEGRVVVLDFGVASDMLHQSNEDAMVGTAAYMAPEQALGQAVGPEADWYAVGVVLYQALTGQLPFSGSLDQMIEQKLSAVPPSPRTLVPEVSPELEELCLALLCTDPRERPHGADIAARLGAAQEAHSFAQHTTFVGRAAELDLLKEAFADTRKGAGATVILSGESGVGKSSLIRRFSDYLHERLPDALVLSGRCYERESVPYKAFDGIVDQLGQLLADMPDDEVRELLPPGAGLLVRAFPVLEMVDELGNMAGDDAVQNPQELRVRVFAALRGLLLRLARRHALVLAIDDLQWADADSLALLDAVMRPPDEPCVLLLAGQRVGTGMGQPSTKLCLPGNVRHLRLDPLPFDNAAELTRRLLGEVGEEDVSDERVRRIVEDAKGHPLFIDELVRLRASGHDGDLIRLDDALQQRVNRLSPPARRTLELLAVAGTPLTLELAARAGSLDFAQLFDIVTGLRAAALVRMSGAARDSVVESYHDRIRESVLAHLAEDARRAWHLRLAGTLEQQDEVDAESVATHWFGAGKEERAAEYYARAAEASSSAMAFERAARLYTQALSSGTFARERTRELTHRLADALENGGQLTAAAEVRLSLARGGAERDGVVQERRAAELLMCSGHYERGLALLRSALSKARIYHPSGRMALLIGLLFWRLWLRVRGLALRERRNAANWAERLAQVDATWSAGHAYAMNDNVRGAYFQTRCLLSALAAGERERVVRALGMAICTQSSGGLKVEAQTLRMLAQEHALAKDLNTPEAFAYASGAQGFADFNSGRFREAKLALGRAETLFRDHCVGVTYEVNSIRGILFRTLFALGELKELRERLAPVLAQAEQQSDRYMIIICQTAGGALVATQADRVEEAERAVAAARERLVGEGAFHLQHYWTYTAEAQVALYRGDAVRALERMNWLVRELKRSLLWRVVPCRELVTALRARAALSASFALPEQAETLRHQAERDAALLLRERECWAHPTAQVIQGMLAAARGQRAEAVAALERGAQGLETLHMRLYAAAAWRVAGQLRGDSEGVALVQRADETFASENVVDPVRMTAMLAGHLPSSFG